MSILLRRKYKVRNIIGYRTHTILIPFLNHTEKVVSSRPVYEGDFIGSQDVTLYKDTIVS